MPYQPRFTIYHSLSQGWYSWTLISGNGRTLAQSGHNFTTLKECKMSITRVKLAAPKAEVIDG